MIIDIFDETQQVDEMHIALVQNIIQFACDFLKLSDNLECSVTLVDNETIRNINRDYRGKDTPTDVISFALDDETSDVKTTLTLDATFAHHIGDIVISIERAKEQADDYGHTFERELGFLAVHGFLHLNGYDHITPSQEEEMFTLQNNIFQAFGLER